MPDMLASYATLSPPSHNYPPELSRRDLSIHSGRAFSRRRDSKVVTDVAFLESEIRNNGTRCDNQSVL